MNKKLHKLIRQYIHEALVNELDTGQTTPAVHPAANGQDISLIDPNFAPGTWIQQTPGAPFANSLTGSYSQAVMSNASRNAVKAWLRFAKAAWSRYGKPIEWPKEVVQKSIDLGQQVDWKIGARQNTANYYRG